MSSNDPYNSSSRSGGDDRGRNYTDDNNNDDPNSAYVPPTERAEYGGGGGHGSENYYDKTTTYTETYTEDPDRSTALRHAQQHGTSAQDETSIFSHALDFLEGNQTSIAAEEDLDEEATVGAHQAVYGAGGAGGAGGQKHSSETMGAGAALQALKMFTGGGGVGVGHGGGSSQAKLIGLAMGQASKLWEEQSGKGNVVSISVTFCLLCVSGQLFLPAFRVPVPSIPVPCLPFLLTHTHSFR
jgi:hypothetical protein